MMIVIVGQSPHLLYYTNSYQFDIVWIPSPLSPPSLPPAPLQSVSFVGGKPCFSKYLDSFPFPYYILLRDIAALPRTLADLLRQWFELSSM